MSIADSSSPDVLNESSTIDFGDEGDDDFVEFLEQTIRGDWRTVDNVRGFEGDLGLGLCEIRIEHNGDGWVGKFSAVNPCVNKKTDPCRGVSKAAFKLRSIVRDHALLLEERAQELLERVTSNA